MKPKKEKMKYKIKRYISNITDAIVTILKFIGYGVLAIIGTIACIALLVLIIAVIFVIIAAVVCAIASPLIIIIWMIINGIKG